ncbi:MAG: FAD-dependent oxidoreductase [Candidatus Brocadiia bacterium]|jgi:NADPH-dependent 2,4-dienoyl-CoA reductase/sulfur reductase-like enzyme
MTEHACDYLIVGGGLAGASAVEGIRERDAKRSVAIIGAEEHLPYDRPPLSKKLWFGKKQVKDIFLHDRAFYDRNGVTLFAGRRVVALDVKSKTVADSNGDRHRFEKLLLATGATPQLLPIPGGDLPGICYYRTLDDYQRMRLEAAEGKSAVIIGGGFIGSEMAAALCINKLKVTMIYPSGHLCGRVFPEDLGLAMERLFQSRGIRILKGQKPASFERKGSQFVVQTGGGKVESDLLIVGVGVKPAVELAERAGLATGDGILVNEYLQTAHPDIHAAGDNARFPYQALGQQARMEHWDNALNQGKHAGRNMAGAHDAFTYMPYFFSDLFEFGYEAVGEVNSRMETRADWQKPFDTGTIYYLRDGKIRGAMMCNVWEKVEAARALIRRGAGADERLA